MIQSIENDVIIFESFDAKKITFSKEVVLMQDSNGNEILNSELNVGDTIEVINVERKYKISYAYTIEPLDDVKPIKVFPRIT